MYEFMINSDLEWVYLGRCTNLQLFTLPENFKEINIRAWYANVGYVSKIFYAHEFNLSSTEYIHTLAGWYYTGSNHGLVNITNVNNTIALRQYWYGGKDVSNECTLDVWYR
jgi:hypothetical protein